MDLSHDRLIALLHYNPETGVFTNRVFRSANARSGEIAGTADKDGYWQIQIDGKIYKSHRLAWFYVTGIPPTFDVDHKDTVKSNNSWGNLRPTTQFLNNGNCRKRKTNTSGFKGVTWDKSRNKWMAQIQVNKRFVYLGRFNDPAQAHEAYKAAAQKHFGEFARTQ